MQPIIRQIKQQEIPLLDGFLYEAIFQRDAANPVPRDTLKQPELQVFIADFGKPDDLCLVAELDGKVVGAV